MTTNSRGDPGFEVRVGGGGGGGAHLKQLRRAKKARTFFGYFVWKITILRQKMIFFPILGGGGGGPPPESAPEFYQFQQNEPGSLIFLLIYFYFLLSHYTYNTLQIYLAGQCQTLPISITKHYHTVYIQIHYLFVLPLLLA